MKINKKLLYATLFASSCLLSTSLVVKADITNNTDVVQDMSKDSTTVNYSISSDNEAEKADDVPVDQSKDSYKSVSQSISDASTSSDNQTNLGSNDELMSDKGSYSKSDDNSSEAVTQPVANTQGKNATYTDTAVNGVYKTGNSFVYLYTADGELVANRALSANSDWLTDYLHTSSDGLSYYRVATNEYAKVTDGTFTSYVQPYSGNATVVYQRDSSIHDFQGYGSNAVYQGNDLPTGTSWKVNNHATMGGKEWYQIGNNTWVPQDYVVINGGQYKDADWISGVPLIAQRPELPNGCEITAVTMMLQYAGANVNKMQLAYEMPRNSNPEYGYIGQPWDSTGITIFPNALMHLVEKYAGTAKDLTGQMFDAIKYQINIGHPVVTWSTLYAFPYHALTVTGYDKDFVYYNDCWANQTLQMGINQFINNWNTQNRRAISY